jgi:LuxR family maltose regulon positive regulatory protein
MTVERPARPLLTVKYAIPPVRAGAVPRPRLVDALRAGSTRLTVVVAPAGWGKTSVLSAWAADPGEHVRVAWVSLDEDDDEPTRFWTYVLTALRGVGAVDAACLDALAAPGLDPVDLVVPLLINGLAVASAPHVLILDDYHAVSDPRIHESVEFLVSYLPPSLRLVLAGRADPPLPLARLRARAELTELRAADLRFSADEATALLAAVAGTEPDAVAGAAAWERTEGWAAGLQLAGLALRERPAPVRADLHLLDYFTAEVLPALVPVQRELLVRAAPLERLSGPLCDAALQVAGSADVLAALERADLFVVALDAGRTWYRCHRLLREVLLLERSAEDERAVLRRAADWFAEHDQLDAAVAHLLRANAFADAGGLLARSEAWFFERGAAATFLVLGEQLPIDAVEPQLALSLAYAATTGGRPDRVPHWLDVATARTGPHTVIDGWHDARAATLMMRALIGVSESASQHAVDLTREAVALEAAGGGEPLTARMALGNALTRDGQFVEAAEILAASWRERDRAGWSSSVVLLTAGSLALSLLQLGRTAELDRLLREAGPLADDVERGWREAAAPVVALLRLVQARRRYLDGGFAEARTLHVRATTLAEAAARPRLLVLALVFLADVELALGDRVAARSALARAREIVTDEPVAAFAVRSLEDTEQRIGRVAARSVTRARALVEELTDRELSILRALPGTATQREIGAALYLSVNTVKAYNKSLYRKLGVASRQDAVVAARRLGLI